MSEMAEAGYPLHCPVTCRNVGLDLRVKLLVCSPGWYGTQQSSLTLPNVGHTEGSHSVPQRLLLALGSLDGSLNAIPQPRTMVWVYLNSHSSGMQQG